MKLAEALIERKATKTKIESLKKRIYQNGRVQAGDEPVEDALELFEELGKVLAHYETLVVRINRTNTEVFLEEGQTLMEALVARDMLRLQHFVLNNLADKAAPSEERYSLREIKFVPAFDVRATRARADRVAQACRELDARIQKVNWTADLI